MREGGQRGGAAFGWQRGKVQAEEGFCDAESCICSGVEVSRERGACRCQRGWGEMGQDRAHRGHRGSALWSVVGTCVPALLEVCAVASGRCVHALLHVCLPACTSWGGIALQRLISQASTLFPQPQGLPFKGFLIAGPRQGDRPRGSRLPVSLKPLHLVKKFSSPSLPPGSSQRKKLRYSDLDFEVSAAVHVCVELCVCVLGVVSGHGGSPPKIHPSASAQPEPMTVPLLPKSSGVKTKPGLVPEEPAAGRDVGTQVLSAPWGAPPLTPCGSQKVMHTRKRHSELYHELNQKFHTFDRYRSQSTAKVSAPPVAAPAQSRGPDRAQWPLQSDPEPWSPVAEGEAGGGVCVCVPGWGSRTERVQHKYPGLGRGAAASASARLTKGLPVA